MVKPDGEDRSEVLLGTPSARNKTIYWEYGRNDSIFKYPQGRNRSPNMALREGKWKFLMNAGGADHQLYDLEVDPNETSNVYALHPQIAANLQKKMLYLRRSLPALPTKVWNKKAKP